MDLLEFYKIKSKINILKHFHVGNYIVYTLYTYLGTYVFGKPTLITSFYELVLKYNSSIPSVVEESHISEPERPKYRLA